MSDDVVIPISMTLRRAHKGRYVVAEGITDQAEISAMEDYVSAIRTGALDRAYEALERAEMHEAARVVGALREGVRQSARRGKHSNTTNLPQGKK